MTSHFRKELILIIKTNSGSKKGGGYKGPKKGVKLFICPLRRQKII